MPNDVPRCRRCGAAVSRGLVATSLRHCCLNPSGIGGVCPEHGPLAPHDVVRDGSDGSDGSEDDANG